MTYNLVKSSQNIVKYHKLSAAHVAKHNVIDKKVNTKICSIKLCNHLAVAQLPLGQPGTSPGAPTLKGPPLLPNESINNEINI